MRILVYLGHPAQYHFFKNAIRILKTDGHDVLILIKTKDILEQLLQEEGLEYRNIQIKNRKKTLIHILLACISRTYKVTKLAKRYKADILLGTDASVAQAAFLLKKKCITTLEDDYEVIKKLCKLTYPFTNTILVPKICDVGKWQNKKIGYEGYMKLAYLHPNRFNPEEKIKNHYIKEDKYVLIRLVQLTAHHDIGIKGLNDHLVRKIIQIVNSKGYKVYISSEVELDVELTPMQLKINPKDIHHVLSYASLLISDSQSMSVEAAMLGIPSIRFSDFSGKINVLEELENEYKLTFGVKTNEPEKLISLLEDTLSYPNMKDTFQERRETMLTNKIDVTTFLCWFIENYPESGVIMKRNPDYQYNFK